MVSNTAPVAYMTYVSVLGKVQMTPLSPISISDPGAKQSKAKQ